MGLDATAVLLVLLFVAAAGWLAFSAVLLRDVVHIYRTFRHGDPQFRAYTLFQLTATLAGILLGLFVGAALIRFKAEIAAEPLLVAALLAVGLLTPLGAHLYRLALRDAPGANMLMLGRHFTYLARTVGIRRAAQQAAAALPARYRHDPTLKARTILPTIHYMRRTLGAAETDALLAELGMPPAYLRYHESDINIEFVNDLNTALMQRTGRGPDVVYAAQSCGANIECMGAMFFLVAGILSVPRVYRAICRLSNYFDENFRNEIVELDERSLTMRCHFRRPGLRERFNPFVAQSVAGWISSIPNVRGLPHARVETRVDPYAPAHAGKNYLEFRVTWVNSLAEGGALLGRAG